MAFLEVLEEMLSRSQVANLAKYVAVKSLDKEKVGDPKQFLDLNSAKKGKVEWLGKDNPLIFDMKGRILRDVISKVENQVGNYEFVDRDSIRGELGWGLGSSIATDRYARLGGVDRGSDSDSD